MILIVEDNRAVRSVIRAFVEDLDADVVECDDGAEALQMFDDCHPDWVLMDLAMRRMDGLTATRRIIADHPQARIAIVTSHDDAGLRRAAHEAGAQAYFVKENLAGLRGLIAGQPAEKS